MRRSNSSKYTHSAFGNAVIMLFLTVFAFVMMVPMIYTICTAFKPNDELFRFPPSIFVQNPTVMNFYSLSSLLIQSVAKTHTVIIYFVSDSQYMFSSITPRYKSRLFKYPFASSLNIIFQIIKRLPEIEGA